MGDRLHHKGKGADADHLTRPDRDASLYPFPVNVGPRPRFKVLDPALAVPDGDDRVSAFHVVVGEAYLAVVVAADGLDSRLDDVDAFVDLLQPVFRRGELVQQPVTIHELRKNAMQASNEFYQMNGENRYSVGLEKKLYDLKLEMIKGVQSRDREGAY